MLKHILKDVVVVKNPNVTIISGNIYQIQNNLFKGLKIN
jgi:hypothetical protein